VEKLHGSFEAYDVKLSRHSSYDGPWPKAPTTTCLPTCHLRLPTTLQVGRSPSHTYHLFPHVKWDAPNMLLHRPKLSTYINSRIHYTNCPPCLHNLTTTKMSGWDFNTLTLIFCVWDTVFFVWHCFSFLFVLSWNRLINILTWIPCQDIDFYVWVILCKADTGLHVFFVSHYWFPL